MKTKLKAVVTITQEYEADEREYYNFDSGRDMIEIDNRNFDADPWAFVAAMFDDPKTVAKIKITKAKEKK